MATLALVPADASMCIPNLCVGGRIGASTWCCSAACQSCGGPGCAVDAPASLCCPSRWPRINASTICVDAHQTGCKLSPEAAGACGQIAGKSRQRKPKRLQDRKNISRTCICQGPYGREYRGDCLPSFMVIGSQKAATSKLRWYLSRHPSIDIPKEDSFHGGPHAVVAWNTGADPTRLSAYLEAFEDICNRSVIAGLKMPDYIVMGKQTINHFRAANPLLRILVTIREPIARLYSYFAMQLRLHWSPIGHMGKNPCMQRLLLQIGRQGSQAPQFQIKRALSGSKTDAVPLLTPEDIMMTNLACVRPCYPTNASGRGDEARAAVWHDETREDCRNIHFTPLVHSLYALHIRRWLTAFDRSAFLLVRFDEIVVRPTEALARVALFLGIPPFGQAFKVELGRENYTTVKRLLADGAMSPASLRRLEEFFQPHNEQLTELWGQSFW